MRVETHYGNRVVCGHIFAPEEIKIGSRWQASSGNTVTVTANNEGWITYEWIEKGETRSHEKQSFAFQCRYCLIVEED